MLDISLKYLDWDSKQLGFPCGLIDCTKLETLSYLTLLNDFINKLIKENKDIEFVTIKLPQNCIETVNSLVRTGATLIDTEFTYRFSKRKLKRFNAFSDNYRFEFCSEVDYKYFFTLAEEMRLSRFFLDTSIPKDKAMHLWETSIKNHCEGFANQLLIAYFDNKPCGIVTIRFDNAEKIFLHIVGVIKEYQGKKIGMLMLNNIIERYAKDYIINVETQSINIPAQKLYEKTGFKFHSLKYILHYWLL